MRAGAVRAARNIGHCSDHCPAGPPSRHRTMPPPLLFVSSRRVWMVALLASSATIANPLCASTAAASESAVKAAFLYKFGGFVEWPASAFARPDEPFVIGVAGDDAVFFALDEIASGRTVQGRPLVVRRVREPQAGLHLLYLGNMREARLREFLPAPATPVLVVTAQEGGLRLGGAINFGEERGRVRFSASPPQATARGLRLSARLLDVAQSVEGAVR
ncbi:MAG: YfiR family protein [Comamonadaceae bacterium]|nr:MAG: YfiR family protein [Comamonadaceae bacterium]